MANATLAKMLEAGQSIWYDNVSRELLNDGSIKSYIDMGVRGLTSNPSIFEKAIAGSSAYDDQIRALLQKGSGTDELLEGLMIEDIRRVADLLMPIYESSGARDGYASIEVSPLLSDDTELTIEAAKRIWKELDRPNAMIKIPATAAGVPAIKAVLEEGINVNVTLIFSVERYREVANCYLEALRNRAAKGSDVSKIASVASFFVSRLDVLVEKTFANAENDVSDVIGACGVANSRLAYLAFTEIFGSAEAKSFLDEESAAPQRPLWASTSSKSPDISEAFYTEELIGRDTVNTVPPKTLDAIIAGIEVEPRVEGGFDQAAQVIASLANRGFPIADLCERLLSEGVESFAKSFESLRATIESKRESLAA